MDDAQSRPIQHFGFRLGRYFGNRAQFWLDLQSQSDIARARSRAGQGNRKTRSPS
jgi:plasmid maintenance system antidote protein VapI